ncbi:MAG TPA: hypothetical protein VKA46_08315 [Gemmataceae bacterium]|nr:hypothetical protein [Gemmataceae bacterium]
MSGSRDMMGRCALLLLLAAAVGVGGCGPSTGAVTGKVYYGEVLLKGGKVTFVGVDGKGATTGIHGDGSYTLDKLPVGTVKICVDTSYLDPKRRKIYAYEPPAGKKVDLPGSPEASPEFYVAIPPKYADPETTDLTCEVTRGSQEYDIRMK